MDRARRQDLHGPAGPAAIRVADPVSGHWGLTRYAGLQRSDALSMRKRWTRWSLLGHEVIDGTGQPVGKVVDTYPFDGGEVELVVVRLDGAFGGRRMLAVEDLWSDGFVLRTPFAAWQVEDSPELSNGRHAAEDPVPRAQLLALRGARDLLRRARSAQSA